MIGEVARDFGLYTKITGGQRIDLFGARVDQLPLIWARLVDAGFESGHAYGKSLRTVKSCVGQTWCRYGVQDSVRMAIDLELRYRGLRSPHKLKSAVSGCARECAEARGRTSASSPPRTAGTCTSAATAAPTRATPTCSPRTSRDAELIRLIDRFLMFYIRTADRLERTSAWLERIDGGLDHVRDVVVQDSLGICDGAGVPDGGPCRALPRRVGRDHQRPGAAAPASSPSSTRRTPPTRRRLRPRARPDQARPAAADHPARAPWKEAPR